ncbi:GGDEF domain-containing protein [Rhizobium sp. CAU 1783]
MFAAHAVQSCEVQSDDIYRKIFYEVADGIVGIDENGIISLCNPSAEVMFGWQPGELIGRPLDVLLPEKVRPHHHHHIADFQSGAVDARYMGQRLANTIGRRADGSEINLGITILRTQTEAGTMMVAVVRDITEVRRYQSELQRLADTDPLTGLLNRRAFKSKAEHEIAQSLSQEHDVSAILFDIDNFKMINDTFGHDAGDDVIRNFACTVRKVMEGYDLVGRWGGEEFVAVVANTSLDRAAEIAEAVRQDVEEQCLLPADGAPVKVTVSAGVTGLNRKEKSLSPLISRADAALYEAKRHGRNRVMLL